MSRRRSVLQIPYSTDDCLRRIGARRVRPNGGAKRCLYLWVRRGASNADVSRGLCETEGAAGITRVQTRLTNGRRVRNDRVAWHSNNLKAEGITQNLGASE